jgi:hypothetical protein
MTDQELMEKVKAIRDKTRVYSWFAINGEALVAHLDGILEGL